MTFLKRVFFLCILIPLLGAMALQILVGAIRWLFTGYNFIYEEDPIITTVAEKLFTK